MTIIDMGCWERGCACYDSRIKDETVEVVRRDWVGLTVEDAVLAEREACARLCDELVSDENTIEYANGAYRCSVLIREREKT
jgi:hypothetical protein